MHQYLSTKYRTLDTLNLMDKNHKKRGSLKIWGTTFTLAEREGFEPSVHDKVYKSFRDFHLRPLGHLSSTKNSIPSKWLNDNSFVYFEKNKFAEFAKVSSTFFT